MLNNKPLIRLISDSFILKASRDSFRVALLFLSILWTPISSSATITDIEGNLITPFDKDSSVLVFYFAAVECPIANRYMPRVNSIYKQYKDEGFHFYVVYTDSSASIAQIQQHQIDYSVALKPLLDFDHELVKYTGVTTTPEVAVYYLEAKDYEQVYRGRIDDQYLAFGKFRRKPNREELKEVLTMIRDGKKPIPYTTQAVGCYITR